MIWLALALCLSAWTLLCLAMDRHYAQIYAAPRSSRHRIRTMRTLGWMVLALSFVLAVLASGWAHGPLYWLGGLTIAGAAVGAWLLPYWPRALVPAAWLLPLLAAVVWILRG